MAKTSAHRIAVAVAVAVLGIVVEPRWVLAAPQPAVVLHVSDLAGVPPRYRADAQRAATRTYERIGVRLVWTDGDAAHAPADGALHLDVIIETGATTDQNHANQAALGEAGRVTRRAYIYYSRIVAHASRTEVDPARLLATVLAHEIGHMLLPEYSHSPVGLMRAEWWGRIPVVPDFTDEQAATIRALLMQANERTPDNREPSVR
jgi:hypothetical protein